MRPHVYEVSKSGWLPTVDTRMKRKDVNDALEIMTRIRDVRSQINGQSAYPKSRFLQLPGEVRNRIYQYTQGIGSAMNPTLRIPSRNNVAEDAFALFRVCKQISTEARSLIEATDTAYLPIMAHHKYEAIIQQILSNGPSSLTGAQSTFIGIILSFFNVRMHLHTNFTAPWVWHRIPEVEIDPHCAYFYGRIRQVLIIFTSASRILTQRWPDRKRHAVLHLDHFFSDWTHMVARHGAYMFKDIVKLMGEDDYTDWELRYYVYTGDAERARSHWPEWDVELTDELRCIVDVCARYANIKVVAEVYGELKWSQEGLREEVTREITPSSRLWPSWPEDVAWRKRSDDV